MDKFLGVIADGVSKTDAITGLRTFDSPFHNEKDYRRQGAETLRLITQKAKREGVKIFAESDLEFLRVQKIVDRLVEASHYRNHKDKVNYAVIDYEDFNALAFGGGYFVVFSGLIEQTNDDELAYIIAHELAHNTAGHIEESYFLKVKDVFGDKPTGEYATSFTNINEQEADRIAIVYTALAGFNPMGSVTIWEKRPSEGVAQYAFYRSHPANPQRANSNRYAAQQVMKHYSANIINPDVEKVLSCNELFCKTEGSEELEDGKGGGLLKTFELALDYSLKNIEAKEEKKKQEQQIAQSRAIIAKQQLETPPNIDWQGRWNVFKGTIKRHNETAGLNFGIANGQGEFYYNFNNQIQQGYMRYHSQNQHGYWYSWQDNWGTGLISLKEYTDGSLRGYIYMNDGTNPGKLLGDFIGYR